MTLTEGRMNGDLTSSADRTTGTMRAKNTVGGVTSGDELRENADVLLCWLVMAASRALVTGSVEDRVILCS
jgi:hypothetical protein